MSIPHADVSCHRAEDVAVVVEGVVIAAQRGVICKAFRQYKDVYRPGVIVSHTFHLGCESGVQRKTREDQELSRRRVMGHLVLVCLRVILFPVQ